MARTAADTKGPTSRRAQNQRASTAPDNSPDLLAPNGTVVPPRTAAVYWALAAAIKEHSYPPSMRELGRLVGLSSPSSVKHQIDALEELGLVRRSPGHSRAIELIAPPSATNKAPLPQTDSTQAQTIAATNVVALPVGETRSIPLVGRIAAGAPITAEQHVEEVYDVPTDFTGTGDLFMLEVSGDSMIDAAICDGDFVIVRAQPDATDGTIVAAMLDGEATVKVLSRSGGHVWLLPRNSSYSPILADECTILGRVVTVMRRL